MLMSRRRQQARELGLKLDLEQAVAKALLEQAAKLEQKPVKEKKTNGANSTGKS